MMQWWDLYVQQPGWLRGIVHFLSIPSCFLAKCLIHKRGSHSQDGAQLWVTSGWSVLEGTLLPLTECPEPWEWDVWSVTFCSFSGSYSQHIIISSENQSWHQIKVSTGLLVFIRPSREVTSEFIVSWHFCRNDASPSLLLILLWTSDTYWDKRNPQGSEGEPGNSFPAVGPGRLHDLGLETHGKLHSRSVSLVTPGRVIFLLKEF